MYIVSKYHLDLFNDLGEVDPGWLNSEENLDYLNTLLTYLYKDENKYGSSILAKIDLYLQESVKTMNININTLQDLSRLNAIVFLDVKRKLDDLPLNQTIDPLWTMKGPGFRSTKKQWNRPGATWAMELGPTGKPQVMSRFANSKTYWTKPSIIKDTDIESNPW